MADTPLGVGILGCGPVTQAIHLPALATLPGRLRVAHVMDVDAGVAAEIGARTGAPHSTDEASLLADPAVDVVAVCSPHPFHAAQVEAACAAGKKAILCEKPLAVKADEVARILAASRDSGVPVIVGAMHVYDPAMRRAREDWAGLEASARLVRSLIVLPANDRFVGFASELHGPPTPAPPLDGRSAAERAAATVMDGILGLATHNLPLIRPFAPAVDELLVARALAPWGYDLAYRAGTCTVRLAAVMPCQWRPDWTLEVWGEDVELHAAFPPSYVLAGSAAVTVRRAGGEQRRRAAENGYQAEWRHVADVAARRCEPLVPVEEAAEDLAYALALAAAATELILEGA